MDYVNMLDGIFDFEFAKTIIQTVIRGEKCIGNQKLQKKIDKHFSYYPPEFDLVLMLDNHDMNRFLYYCNNNTDRLLDALSFMKMQHKSFSVYYGTECLMTNHKDIFDKTAYADLRVREPFQLSPPKIAEEIAAIIKK